MNIIVLLVGKVVWNLKVYVYLKMFVFLLK